MEVSQKSSQATNLYEAQNLSVRCSNLYIQYTNIKKKKKKEGREMRCVCVRESERERAREKNGWDPTITLGIMKIPYPGNGNCFLIRL